MLWLPDWRSLDGVPVFYAVLIGDRDDIDALRRELEPVLTGCFDTVGPDGYSPHQTWFEITSIRATKAAASHALALRLCAERLVAFGDNLNDVALLAAADHGCAVANAVPQLLGIADEVLLSNSEDGVAEWLEQNVLDARPPAT